MTHPTPRSSKALYRANSVPADAVGLKLHRIDGRGELHSCEGVRFLDGRDGVDTVLRRASIAGRVELGGDIQDHFADVLDASGSMIETIALDADSYHILKNKWMPCKVQRS